MKRSPLTRRTALAKRGARGLTLEKLDELMRQFVKIRDGGRCRVCVALGEHRDGCRVLQAHHIKNKGSHPSLRYEPKNLILVGQYHHLFKIHGMDPDWWAEHKELVIGRELIEELEVLALHRKGTKLDKQAVKLYLEGLIKGAACSVDTGSSQESGSS